ncbi:MAG: anthranilate synthase component I [Armatimonadetes bacterium]|nr:anthranilate synthase component I [Armatimonadota bacterium]
MYYPSREAFIKKAQQGNLIPVYRELLADMETPVSAFKKIRETDFAFLLESVETGERIGRYSFMSAEPVLIFSSKGPVVEIAENGKTTRRTLEPGEDPLMVLKSLLGRYTYVGDPGLPPFSGGAVGYIGYDMVRFFEKLPQKAADDLPFPDCSLMFTDTLLIFDHLRKNILVLCNAHVQDDPAAAYGRAIERIEHMVVKLKQPLPHPIEPKKKLPKPEIRSNLDQIEYEKIVRKAKQYIASGDIIQAVLSQRFETSLSADPFDVYRALRSLNPSPYMYYLALNGMKIVGSSPEILVTKHGSTVTTRPIAGSCRRGDTAEEDEELIARLLSDGKERAEHIMLVDLGRNDLGRVSEYGSVKVDRLMATEKYSHVTHIVSDVRGALRPGQDQFDALRACFPAGTLSGAPKIRAMEIIEELEPHRRGPYGGAVGYFGFSGDMDTCITIRTLVFKDGTAYFQAGAGIVADSVPEKEHNESVMKARALVRAIEMAEEGLE